MSTETEWRELYDWLGREAESAQSEADEASVNIDAMGLAYQAEAFIMVRSRMRGADPGLPPGEVDGL